MTKQLALRIPDQLIHALDQVIAEGRFANRTEAVRTAIGQLVERERRAVIGDAIVAGYHRLPETDDELATSHANLRRLLEEESW